MTLDLPRLRTPTIARLVPTLDEEHEAILDWLQAEYGWAGDGRWRRRGRGRRRGAMETAETRPEAPPRSPRPAPTRTGPSSTGLARVGRSCARVGTRPPCGADRARTANGEGGNRTGGAAASPPASWVEDGYAFFRRSGSAGSSVTFTADGHALAQNFLGAAARDDAPTPGAKKRSRRGDVR